MKRFIVLTCSALCLVMIHASSQDLAVQADQNPLWQDVSLDITTRAADQLLPRQFRLVQANFAQLQKELLSTLDLRAGARGVILELPLPDGEYGRFDAQFASIMESNLASNYPQIQTFTVQGIDDPTASGRLDLTPLGFHAYIQGIDGDIFIDPYQYGDVAHYIVYEKSAAVRSFSQTIERAPVSELNRFNPFVGRAAGTNLSVGDTKRTFRLALSATGEFTEAQCAVAGAECLTAQQAIDTAFAAIVTGINRVNQIYERDLSISFVLIDGTDQLIFSDPTSDPYSDTEDIEVTLDESPGVIDGVIPLSNYDIGHVVSSGPDVGGGIAYPFSCDADIHAEKMTGATALETVVGDPFWIDYVAHEIGHQFFADHSYNASAGGACTTRSATESYEPGSGSTIMGYVGICGGQDLQDQADAMFNAGAFHEMISHVTTGFGSGCGIETATGNSAPTVEAGENYAIPKETPFRLTANISDNEQAANALTVSWEQFSIGEKWSFDSILPNTDQQDGRARPILRVFPPSSSPVRIIPSLANILDGSYQNIGEDLPSVSQAITFRATARDNVAGNGGVASDDMELYVIDSAGPFRITSHTNSKTIDRHDSVFISWDVANTNQSPIFCSAVDITLSLDGGVSFDVRLATGTPNDGSQIVLIPGTVAPSRRGRIQVKCNSNIFFDINKANLTITNSDPVELTETLLLPFISR